MDSIEQYLKIEKMDATQISESAVRHKEEKWMELNQIFSDFENKGKKFITEATDDQVDHSLDTKRAVTVVQALVSQFSERRGMLSEFYEQWKSHVAGGKNFKTQWHQFIQDARKVSTIIVNFIQSLLVNSTDILYTEADAPFFLFCS